MIRYIFIFACFLSSSVYCFQRDFDLEMTCKEFKAFNYRSQCDLQKLFENYDLKISEAKRQEFLRKSSDYFKEGMSYLDMANQICWYIPDMDMNRTISIAIQGAAGSIMAGSPIKVVMSTLLSVIGSYGACMFESYQRINLYVDMANTCFESSEFYANLALKG